MTNDMDIKAIADHAATQSDRWWTVALFLILVAAALIIWRWIIADREKVANRLTEVTDRHIVTVEKLSDVVANNTAALNEVREVMRGCRLRNQG